MYHHCWTKKINTHACGSERLHCERAHNENATMLILIHGYIKDNWIQCLRWGSVYSYDCCSDDVHHVHHLS